VGCKKTVPGRVQKKKKKKEKEKPQKKWPGGNPGKETTWCQVDVAPLRQGGQNALKLEGKKKRDKNCGIRNGGLKKL